MKLASLAALLFAASAFAQSSPQPASFSDPANLRGERVSPETGRELPIDQGASGLEQLLRKLQTRASLMLIVAHPDDEDGGMLTLYSRGQGARVATLTLTRGEGGQNAMTGDFEDALGLIRTQELLAADRYFDADQMFGTEVDFGFSKTKEEAFRKWTHERVLYDAVRAVRLYRPLVLAAVFIGGVTDGHGQHQVSGQIAQEVFKAAGDPKVFPELTREGILPWSPLKVYGRVPGFAISPQGLFDYATNQYVAPSFTNYVTGETSSTPPTADVVLHEGQPDPLLGEPGQGQRSYVQFARLGLGLQRTQIGPGVRRAPAGAFDINYHLYGSRLCSPSGTSPRASQTGCVRAAGVHAQDRHDPEHAGFFDGVDTSLNGIAGLSSAPPRSLREALPKLQEELAAVQQHLDRTHPAASAAALVSVQHELGGLLYALEQERFPGKPDVLHELRVKQVQLNQALVCALDLHLEAKPEIPSADVLRGSAFKVQTALHSVSGDAVGVFSEAITAGTGEHRQEKLLAIDQEPALHGGEPYRTELQVPASFTARETRPYFTRDDAEQPVYRLADPSLRNAPATPPPVTAWATLRFHGTEIQVGRMVELGGEPLSVVPPASISSPSVAVLAPQDQPSLLLTVQARPAGTRVEAGDVPRGWRVEPAAADGTDTKAFRVFPPPASTAIALRPAAVLPDGQKVSEGFRAAGYPGVPRTNFFTPTRIRIVPADLRLPKRRRVAYLAGTGDAVADNLRSVGLEVTPVHVSDLTPASLSRFDTVILGVRTYSAHPDLHGAPTEALLSFARNGGNVIVQYQTAEFSGADAPYPLSLGSAEKVVDETTPVRLLNAGTQALSYPNHITPADFSGWVEERGHGFLDTWDPQYTALTETQDPGSPAEHVAAQKPQMGGLITAPLGRGHWSYCAYALYRQLPEAVPGAFRVLVNLVGLADKP